MKDDKPQKATPDKKHEKAIYRVMDHLVIKDKKSGSVLINKRG